MRELVYDVATSIDGFIAGPNEDVSRFVYQGPHVDAYAARMATYTTVVMGRRTYELGYTFGLAPGARAYPHMDHHIISASIVLPEDRDVTVVKGDAVGYVERLKAGEGGPIYLCGGGELAGALLDAGLVDRVVLKVNPIVLGDGVRLFGPRAAHRTLTLESVHRYDNGVVLMTYAAS